MRVILGLYRNGKEMETTIMGLYFGDLEVG